MDADATDATELLAPAEEAEIEAAKTRISKKKGGGDAPRATAETMAAKQRDISVSEFFAKNRHLLGFDNPRKAILTTVKEAVDNSLDACEEAGILPEITVVIEDLQPERPASAKTSRYRITVVDNGPGIVRKQVENVFGRLLFGSKFHRLKMSRGQQGIGISAAGMYGLITTGKPMMIQTRPDAKKRAHHIELAMNTKTNRAEVTADEETDDFPLKRLRDLTPGTRELADTDEFLSPSVYKTGTSVTIELEGKYQRGRGSVDEFLELTAIANPHGRFVFVRPTRETAEEEDDAPLLKGKAAKQAAKEEAEAAAAREQAKQDGKLAVADPSRTIEAPAGPQITTETNGVLIFPRGITELPPETKEIQPHPRGVELGTLLQMLKDYELAEKGGTLYNFLQERFCRISGPTASTFCDKIGVTSRTKASDIEPPQAEKLYKEFMESKLAPPPTDCLAPIGVSQLLKGMHKGVRAEFYAASSREAAVYRGRPFLIEAAIAFGGQLPGDDTGRVIRFANRVPLLFQQSACSSFKAVTETNWRNYDLQQPRGGLPIGPLVIMIHMASVWVPFTSESKEAVADYDEIRKEMKLALMECGRKLGIYLRRRQKMKQQADRRDIFQRYIGEVAQACGAITGDDPKKLYDALALQAKKKTAQADLLLDEDGKIVKDDPEALEGVIIVDDAGGASDAPTPVVDDTPTPKRKNKAPSTAEESTASMKPRGKSDTPPAREPVTPAKRSKPDAKPKASSTASPSAKANEKTTATPSRSAAAPSSGGEKPAKRRARLVNGKLVYLDDDSPQLFA